MPTTAREILADQMRRRRHALGLSQEALAEHAQLHRTYISAIERQRRNVGIDNIDRIATALGCAPSDLLSIGDP